MKRKIASFFVVLILVFSTLTSYATPLSVSPGNGDTFSADNTGADSLTFYLDGEYIGEADSSGNIKAPSLDGGTHNLKAVAVYSDGSAACDEVVFSSGVKAVIKEQNENFNNYDGTGTSVNFTQYKKDTIPATFSVAEGKSGSADDKALGLSLDLDDKVIANMPYIQTTLFTGFTQGMSEVEFDIKFTTRKSRLRIAGLQNWTTKGTSDIVIDDANWRETGVPISIDNWQHVKFIINHDAGIVSFEVDGEETVIKDKPINYGSGDYVRISLYQAKITPGDPRGGYTIDNFKAINYKNYKGITNMSVEGDNVKLELDTPIDNTSITKDKISLKTLDGQQIGVESVSFIEGENALAIVPSAELPKACKLVASISEGITLTNGGKTQNSMTASVELPSDLIDVDVDFFVNSDGLHSTRQIGAGDVISAQVNVQNVSQDDTDLYCILTLRKGKQLVSISASPLSVSALSTGNVTLELPSIAADDDYEVYLMTCDNLDSAVALSRIHKITKN